jgi:hypothetical protein
VLRASAGLSMGVGEAKSPLAAARRGVDAAIAGCTLGTSLGEERRWEAWASRD